MKKKTVSGIMLTLLLISMLTFAFNVQPVKAEPKTWTVDDDGPADFSRIQDAIDAASPRDTIFVYNGTYYENVVVNKSLSLIGENRDSTIIDGNSYGHLINLKASSISVSGFTLQSGVSGIFADHTHYHIIENNILQDCNNGIYLYGSLGNELNDNLMTGNNYGFRIDESYYNTLRRNEMRDNLFYNFYFDLWGIIYDWHFVQDIDASNTVDGKPIYWWTYQSNKRVPTDAGFVVIFRSSNISIEDLELTKNNHGVVFLHTHSSNIENVTIQESETGIALHVSHYNNIRGNRIADNGNGIILEKSSYNTVERNNIENNGLGIITFEANNNKIYHNNFNNTYQVHNPEPWYSINIWDDGYPSGGNYWSDYTGVDFYSGHFQNETGSDGIGDASYVIDADNRDRYPLMKLWSPPIGIQDVAVLNVTPSTTEVYVGSIIDINVTVKSNGDFTENRTVTVYYNSTLIGTQYITLASEENITLTFSWDTIGVAPGNYTIKAVANIVIGEANITDNTLIDGLIRVKMLGDVNGDNKIDIRDISMAALAFGSYPDHPRWNMQADINQDRKVDIRDLLLIAKNLGKTYS